MSKLKPWLDVMAIGAWGFLMLKLWLTGQLYLLIHPNYIWLAVLSGFVLLLASFLEAWRISQQRRYDTEAHVTLMLPAFSSSLLLVVAIMGLLITPRPFASETALHRGVTETLSMIRSKPESFRSNSRPEERSLIEWKRTLDVYPEPDAYTGQKVKVQGFVVHTKELPDNFLMISRFVITCCAADVYPVGMPVKLSQGRSAYPPDKWLEIEGQMITEDIAGKRQLTIQPNKLTPIPEPKNPYDY
jgi:uncharacterized repeat protein (TIGR03943 family)